MPQSVLVNGVNYAWVNISVILFGVPLVGIVAINYKRKQNKTNNYGAGSRPTSRGYGAEEYEGDIEIYTDVWKSIIAGSPDRNPMLIPMFDMPIAFGGNGVAAQKDTLKAVEFLEDPLEGKQGDTKLTVKIPLIIGDIQR